MYDFIARNSTELSVQQGETLEVTTPATSHKMGWDVFAVLLDSVFSGLTVKQVLESSKRWWKCKNYFNQVGFVPFNILQPTTHMESPVSSRPPSVRPAHMTCCAQATMNSLQCEFTSAPPTPPPAGYSPAAPPEDLLGSPTQPSGSTPLRLPAASAQLTTLQPAHTSSRRH